MKNKYQEKLKFYNVAGIHISYSYTGNPNSWDVKAHQVFIDVQELDQHEEVLEAMGE